jgi:tetratricopeptide (TPR) repeat protein
VDIGRVHRLRGEPTLAAEAFRKAGDIDPQDPSGYDGLGLLAYDAGDLDTAAARFARAVAVQPDYANGHGHLGWTHYGRGQWADAAAAFRKAIDLGATTPEYLYELGLSLIYLGECDEGKPWLERALERDPGLTPALDGLALCP